MNSTALLQGQWKAFKVSILHRMDMAQSQWRPYELDLEQASSGAEERKTKWQVLHGPSYGKSSVSIAFVASHILTDTPVMSSFLFCKSRQDWNGLAPGQRWFPLLLIKGSLKHEKLLIGWLEAKFDTRIVGLEMPPFLLFRSINLCFDPDLSEKEDGELALSFSPGVADMKVINVSIPWTQAQALWNRTEIFRKKSKATIDSVGVFIQAISEHFESHFGLQLRNMVLVSFASPYIHVHADGIIKFQSESDVSSFLELITSLCM